MFGVPEEGANPVILTNVNNPDIPGEKVKRIWPKACSCISLATLGSSVFFLLDMNCLFAGICTHTHTVVYGSILKRGEIKHNHQLFTRVCNKEKLNIPIPPSLRQRALHKRYRNVLLTRTVMVRELQAEN